MSIDVLNEEETKTILLALNLKLDAVKLMYWESTNEKDRSYYETRYSELYKKIEEVKENKNVVCKEN